MLELAELLSSSSLAVMMSGDSLALRWAFPVFPGVDVCFVVFMFSSIPPVLRARSCSSQRATSPSILIVYISSSLMFMVSPPSHFFRHLQKFLSCLFASLALRMELTILGSLLAFPRRGLRRTLW